jgi:hypothetical protein
MATANQEPVYCSDISLQADEPLYGSATQTQAFLLLEYTGAWGQKALEQSEIPEAVKARLNELGKTVRNLKTLLIKTEDRQRHGSGIRFFVASLSQRPSGLYAFQLGDYLELLDLDIPAILAGGTPNDSHRRELPLYLVCTNGRRDLCCARHGIGVYNALSAAAQTSPEPLVWQSTHVGGHRFAANLICLPNGVLYGRVRPENALAILHADRNGRIYLPNLRGRLSVPPVAQAAEYYLRQQQGVDAIDAYRLLDVQDVGNGEWQVRFESLPDGNPFHIRTRAVEIGQSVFESCTLDKSTPIVRYEFQLLEK